MATQNYIMTLSTEDSTYSYTGQTGDLTGYRTTITIQTNTDCTAKIQYSDNGAIWEDYTPPDESSAEFDVNTTTYSETVRLAKYVRVAVMNDGAGETDSVTVSFSAISESPTYASAQDVAKYLGWIAEDTDDGLSRFVFSSSTIPTLAEVNEMLLAAEDDIDDKIGHAWRSRQIVKEYHDFQTAAWVAYYEREREARAIKLSHRSIRDLTSGTDTVEVWDGSDWVDWVSTKTEGRGSDFWMDYTDGIFFFRESRPLRRIMTVRFTYRYGESTVPEDIRKAAALIVARDLMMAHDHMKNIPEGADAVTIYGTKLREWEKYIERTIEHRKELEVV